MICANCKRFTNTRYCANCGAQPVDHNCPQCKNQLSFHQKFCEKCGMKCPQPPSPPQPIVAVLDRAIADEIQGD